MKLNRTAIFNSDDWILHSKLDLLQEQVPQVAARIISIPIEVPFIINNLNNQTFLRLLNPLDFYTLQHVVIINLHLSFPANKTGFLSLMDNIFRFFF